MLEDYNQLSGMQLDALKEIGNIGAGNAATALAVMVNSKIDMTVPRVTVMPFDEVTERIGGAEKIVVGIYLGVSGSAKANILFLFEIERALALVDMLMGRQPGETVELDEIGWSAMQEVGNIISGTYLNALAMFTQLTLLPTVPMMGMDMAGAIIDAVLAQYGAVGDYVLALETEFTKGNQDVVGHFFLLPEPGALDVILKALGVSM
ncbi:MAG: chemotaxis protein CheC [Solirubrobacterales bacterium]